LFLIPDTDGPIVHHGIGPMPHNIEPLAMTENIMVRLGATAEQLDRARARVRNEIDKGAAGPPASARDYGSHMR
jgi:hypothetical protein